MRRILYYIIKNEMDKENMHHKIDTTNAMMVVTIIIMSVMFLFMLFSSN